MRSRARLAAALALGAFAYFAAWPVRVQPVAFTGYGGSGCGARARDRRRSFSTASRDSRTGRGWLSPPTPCPTGNGSTSACYAGMRWRGYPVRRDTLPHDAGPLPGDRAPRAPCTLRPRQRGGVSLKTRVITGTLAGLAYGALLSWLAIGAAGYGGDSLPLSLVLIFMAGFPVSLPLSGFHGYFIGLAAPLFWAAFGAVVSRNPGAGRAYRAGSRLLLVHYIGILIGMLAVPWAVESSAHVPARSVAGVVLVLPVYAAGQVAWWRTIRLLDRLREGEVLPRPVVDSFRLGRLVAGVLALTFAFVALAEHETLVITCRREPGECEIVRQGWRTSTRRIPIEDVTVSFGVPRSRLEIASPTRRETLISVGCTDRRTGVDRNAFSRCESRGGRLLATLSEFLGQKRAPDVRIVDEDPWPSRTAAAILLAAGLWLVTSAFVTLRARASVPAYRRPAPRPPVARPPASRPPAPRPPALRPPVDPRRSR